MKLSPLRFSLSISLLVLLSGFNASAQEKVTCRAEVVFHGQEITGRMMFKQVSDDTVRFAFFNELGMSFVEGSVSVRSRVEILRVADFLDYKSFRKNLEKGLAELVTDRKTGGFVMPGESEELLYRKGRKFSFRLVL